MPHASWLKTEVHHFHLNNLHGAVEQMTPHLWGKVKKYSRLPVFLTAIANR